MDKTELFISGLDEGDKFLRKIQKLYNCEVRKPGEGVAIVTVDSQKAVNRLLRRNNKAYKGSILHIHTMDELQNVKKVIPKGTHTVFVANLSPHTTEKHLVNFFSGCGVAKRISLPTDDNHGLKGHGHIEFTTSSAAALALLMSGHKLNGKPIRIESSREKGRRKHRK